MLAHPPPTRWARSIRCCRARCSAKQPGARSRTDFPERLLRWVNHIPAGMTVYCGHDQRSRDGRPWVAHGDGGGSAVFMDTGAGKGGHLSWVDLD